ncbi:hypothetical protein [Halobacterium hubeiense]|uniref:hypothetical protein n=1 Tax=Halobacterium hubeiense TaxID=1407499 RepID=UPI000B7F9F68|nr:hypothetical protein [Halobacterium hubeiense]
MSDNNIGENGAEDGRGGPQKPSDHIYTGKDEDLISYLGRESINWTYHHRYSEETVEEPFMEMVAYCLATYHDGVPITPKGYVTDEVEA